jgi:hypothetical protein
MLAAFAALEVLLPAGPAAARPAARADSTTINMLAYFTEQPGYSVLIANFERVLLRRSRRPLSFRPT